MPILVKSEHPHPRLGAQGALGALVVSFLPAWVSWHSIGDLLTGQVEWKEVPLVIGIVAICFLLVYWLVRLAYRLWTGQSRPGDGHLVSPVVLLLFALNILIGGGYLIAIASEQTSMGTVIPGVAFLSLGGTGVVWSIKKIRRSA